jgi:hypothetical protein
MRFSQKEEAAATPTRFALLLDFFFWKKEIFIGVLSYHAPINFFKSKRHSISTEKIKAMSPPREQVSFSYLSLDVMTWPRWRSLTPHTLRKEKSELDDREGGKCQHDNPVKHQPPRNEAYMVVEHASHHLQRTTSTNASDPMHRPSRSLVHRKPSAYPWPAAPSRTLARTWAFHFQVLVPAWAHDSIVSNHRRRDFCQGGQKKIIGGQKGHFLQ